MESITILINFKEKGYETQRVMHQGRWHIVAPVTMIVEGVLKGSAGPLLHLAEDFGKVPGSWDGIPVVINHPEKEGVPISANSPQVIDAIAVGRVYNTYLHTGELKAEIWLDEEKLEKVSPDTLSALKRKESIEVSVGVFTENEENQGVYKEEEYYAIAKNHRPDHLALLPGGVGACSLVDGCGVHANKLVTNINENEKEIIIMAEEKVPCTPCVKTRVDALIANTATAFTEDDRVMLETFSKEQLDKLVPVTVEKEVEKEVKVEVPVTMSKEDKAALEFGKKMLAQRKATMTKTIQANTAQGTWPTEVLANMDEEMLERIFKSVSREEIVDYSLNGGNTIVDNSSKSEVTPLIPFLVEEKSK